MQLNKKVYYYTNTNLFVLSIPDIPLLTPFPAVAPHCSRVELVLRPGVRVAECHGLRAAREHVPEPERGHRRLLDEDIGQEELRNPALIRHEHLRQRPHRDGLQRAST